LANAVYSPRPDCRAKVCSSASCRVFKPLAIPETKSDFLCLPVWFVIKKNRLPLMPLARSKYEMNTLIPAQEDGLQSTAISTTIYIDEVPPFVESELQRLYAHIHASLPFIQIFKAKNQISTYVARRGAIPIAILPFHLERRRIVILTQMIRLDSIELQRFAACAFEHFPSIGVISFKSVQTDLLNFPYRVQRGHSREDNVINLPSTPDDYTLSLGKSTRKNLKRYRVRLEQKFPSISFETFEKKDIEEKIVRDLIKLSELRVTAKGITFGIDSDYTRGMIALAMVYGVLNVIWIEGRLCGGMISYRIGSSQYAEVIAHDESYNDYSPGMLCCYMAICESITKGVKTFHMGSGRLGYKVWLLGVQQNMEQVEIYRSLAAMALNCDWVMRNLGSAFILRLKTWLRSRENTLPVRLLIRSRSAMFKMMKG
jgi:hypothetical protein